LCTYKTAEQENPAVAREDALQPIQFLLQYWPSRSSKVDDFDLIWKGVCDILDLLVINSNLGPISRRLATIHPLQKTDDGRTDVQQPCQRRSRA